MQALQLFCDSDEPRAIARNEREIVTLLRKLAGELTADA
jgi:hypothetical protein